MMEAKDFMMALRGNEHILQNNWPVPFKIVNIMKDRFGLK